MSKDETIVSTVEEFEQFINNHQNCVVYATKDLDDKLNRNMSTNFNKPPEDFDLFFKIYELLDLMAEKSIRYEVMNNEQRRND